MTLIFAIDPGAKQKSGTLEKRGTGIAAVTVHAEHEPILSYTELLPGGTAALIEALLSLDTRAGDWFRYADVVVVENFRLLEARANIEPLEMVGVVRGLCAAAGKMCVVQEPAQRTIVSHDDLKRIGMWPGGAGHADEAQAVRHALARALKSGNRPTVELLAPDEELDQSGPSTGPSSW